MNRIAPDVPNAFEPVDYDPFAAGELACVVPSTESQREIWLADQLSPEASLAFNLSVSLRLTGALDPSALQRALQELVDRHDALRSTVGPEGQTLAVLLHHTVELPRIDLSAMDATSRKQRVAERIRATVETPFRLDAPMFRAELLQLGADDHLLLLCAHHIVCDGWSWWVIVRELGALYGRHRDGGKVQAEPSPSSSFAEFALAEGEGAGFATQAEDEAYWLSRFPDTPPVLELCTDHPRPAVRSFASAREDHVIDGALLQRLRQLGSGRGVSLFATLLGGFAALLSRLSGQSDVVVGIPAAGQPLAGLDDLVGHCVNTLPLRFRFGESTPFAQVLDESQATLLDSLEHQRHTLGTLLKKLRMRRDPARIPLVSVLFNLDQALDREGAAFPGLAMEFDSNPRSFETFELFVNAVQVGGQLRLECQYNRDLFDGSTVRRWLQAYETLLRAAVERETAAIASLPLLDASARAELYALQPLATQFDRDRRMHEHFEVQCDRMPERVALECGNESLSYADLERRANQVAHVLREHGVRRGALVGLALDRNADMLAALLGILKAGAGYVPLDPQFPPDRLAYMAADAGLALLLTTREHAGRFDLRGRPVLLLDEHAMRFRTAPESRLERDEGSALAEDAAYVIYTSGSTGRPKGVIVPHRAVSNFLAGMQREPGLSRDDRLLAITTLSFDIAVLELLLPLSVGAVVVLADRETVADGRALRAMVEDSRITVMQGTPSSWRLLLDAGWNGSATFKAMCGGEPMAPDLASALLVRCGSLWNLYGPTETTVWSTCARIERDAEGGSPDVQIGRPIANTRVWVVDAHGELCPLGIPGEVCIGGEGVTTGYLGRPELTADRFVPDRFIPSGAEQTAATARLYRTGDRGRWRPDGRLEHLGRLDHQVKVRGYRIELGEIEANLMACAEVARAVVIVREDRANDQRLVAYLVTTPGERIEEGRLRDHLRTLLPAYMVPQHFVVLDAIPLLPNGKVDRHALPAPDVVAAQLPRSEQGAGAVVDARVRYLMQVWTELLGFAAGPEDNFFELGGHSMLAVQMAARVERETGHRIKLIRLGAETLAQVAAALPAVAEEPAVAPGVGSRLGNGLRRLFGWESGRKST